MGNHNAPAALGLDFGNAAGNRVQIVPAEGARLGGCGGNALGLIGHAEHSDAACFVKIQRLRGFPLVHARTDGAAAHFRGDLFGAQHALGPGIHGVIVADAPDIRMHILEHTGGGGAHAVKKHTARAIVHSIDQRAFHIGHCMIGAVKKVQHRLG